MSACKEEIHPSALEAVEVQDGATLEALMLAFRTSIVAAGETILLITVEALHETVETLLEGLLGAPSTRDFHNKAIDRLLEAGFIRVID